MSYKKIIIVTLLIIIFSSMITVFHVCKRFGDSIFEASEKYKKTRDMQRGKAIELEKDSIANKIFQIIDTLRNEQSMETK